MAPPALQDTPPLRRGGGGNTCTSCPAAPDRERSTADSGRADLGESAATAAGAKGIALGDTGAYGVGRRPPPRESPVPHVSELSLYREALLFLVTAGVVAPLFVRLRISPVLGYVLAGALLRPYGLGRLADRAPWLKGVLLTDIEAIGKLAEFGVVTLMFTIGLELSF